MDESVEAPYFLGVELTAGQLVLLLQDRSARVRGAVTRSYAKNDSRLRDPLDWWRALRTGTKDLIRRTGVAPEEVRGVGLTGPDTGTAAAFLDEKGDVLCQVPVEAEDDGETVDAFERQVGRRNLLNLTGRRAHGHCLAVQLLRLRDEHKRVWQDVRCILPPRDFLRYRLTGTRITDASQAAASLLFNSRNRSWSKQLMKLLDLDPAWFPEVSQGSLLSGRITDKAATETGLAGGTPVVVGASRSLSMACVCGVLERGEALLELGDAGTFLVVDSRPTRADTADLTLGCHCLADRWTLELPGATGDRAFSWFTRLLAPGEVQQWRRGGQTPLEVYADAAASVEPGADGVRFVPDLEADATATFGGIAYRHGRPHLLRAIFDGGLIRVRRAIEDHAAEMPAIERLCVAGTGARLPFWRQLAADVLGLPVEHRDLSHAPAQGAALLATVAAGTWPDLARAVAESTVATDDCPPDPDGCRAYDKTLASYAAATE